MELETTLHSLAPRLLRFTRGLARDDASAEEAAQDALTALVDRWRRLGPPESPDAFVFAIARRRLRRAQLRQHFLEPLESLFGEVSPEPDPERWAGERRALRSTLEALGELPRRLREALLLVSVGELDGSSAAEVLGISRSALKMRVHRARQQLQEQLPEAVETLR